MKISFWRSFDLQKMLSCTAEYFLKDKDMWGALMCSRDKNDLESVLGADIEHVPQSSVANHKILLCDLHCLS